MSIDHALRRPDRRRNRLPRQPKSLAQISTGRRNDHVQRLDLHAGAGPAEVQGDGPRDAAGRGGVDWGVGGFGCCFEGEERCVEVDWVSGSGEEGMGGSWRVGGRAG